MFEGIPLVSLTPSVLLGITVLMILLGKLRTNTSYQEKVKESDTWRKAYEAEREARATSDKQTGELLELAKTTHDILIAVFQSTSGSPGTYVGRRRERSGGADVVPTQR